MIRKLLARLPQGAGVVQTWFFPRRCVWCQGVTEPAHMLCPDCEEEAAAHKTGLSRVPGTQIPLVSGFSYHSGASRILLNLKFHGGYGYVHSIGCAMGDFFLASGFAGGQWLFCCVPMTDRQRGARGFNQSELLAGAAARRLKMEHAPGLLRKTRETQTQHDLPAEQREANVAGAYCAAAPESIQGQRIVLCDDICTTGATLRACARALEEAGAAEIVCLTYLRTLLREQ